MLENYEVILASGSPRRRELLAMLDVDFRVDTSVEVDETYPADLPAAEVAPYLSRLKARAHQALIRPGQLVITADTVVILDGQVIGKPRDEADARAMLARLSGRVHEVVTGVTLTTAQGMETFAASSRVNFADLTPQEIAHYVEKYRPLDKAGAYGIQEWIGAAAIRGIDGSFYNVMGLPVQMLYTRLKQLG